MGRRGNELAGVTSDALARRAFLKRAGAMIGGSALLSACARVNLPGSLSIDSGGERRVTKPGLQLYSLRELMQRDPDGTLARIAAAGYSEVEFAGFYGRTAAEMRRLIDSHSLSSPAGHVSLEELRGNFPQLIADARTMGWTWLICPWINEDERSAAGYENIVRDFNRFGRDARAAGLRFAFHAEVSEYRALPNGAVPYDVILDGCDPNLVEMELDTYWAVRGGRNPVAYFERYPGRFPLLHLKDMSAEGEIVNLGDGIIDFRNILAASGRAGTRHFIIENDEPRNPVADITAMAAYLRSLRF